MIPYQEKLVEKVLQGIGIFHFQWLSPKPEVKPEVQTGIINRKYKPDVQTCPSGSSYDFSREEEDAAVAISCSKSRAT